MIYLGFFLQAADEEAGLTAKNVIDILTQGGPLGIAINVILLVLSIIALYLFFERYFTIKKATQIDDSFMSNIRAVSYTHLTLPTNREV